MCVRKIAFISTEPRKEGKVEAMKVTACAVIVGNTTIVPEKFGRKYESAIIEGPIELIDDPSKSAK